MLLRLHRVRIPLIAIAMVVLLGDLLLGLVYGGARDLRSLLVLAALLVGLAAFVALVVGNRSAPVAPQRTVRAPVRGTWRALNSPATKVPSHGVRGYGQAYAIDLVHEPEPGARPAFGGAAFRAADRYPAFGEQVTAMIDGEVVDVSDRHRDHRARSSLASLTYLMVEAAVRELGGPGFIVGNHVTIRGDDGVFALVAHLQRGSVVVRPGDRVRAGDPIGRCGNSGNSSEPHVHAQLMDRASLWTAQGVPMAFAGITLGESSEAADALPANDEVMHA